MSDKLNGGPAFPWDGMGNNGMTLRDYFAAKAMAALIASPFPEVSSASDVATVAYFFADAMLKARNA